MFFWLRNKKIKFSLRTLNLSPDRLILCVEFEKCNFPLYKTFKQNIILKTIYVPTRSTSVSLNSIARFIIFAFKNRKQSLSQLVYAMKKIELSTCIY